MTWTPSGLIRGVLVSAFAQIVAASTRKALFDVVGENFYVTTQCYSYAKPGYAAGAPPIQYMYWCSASIVRYSTVRYSALQFSPVVGESFYVITECYSYAKPGYAAGAPPQECLGTGSAAWSGTERLDLTGE